MTIITRREVLAGGLAIGASAAVPEPSQAQVQSLAAGQMATAVRKLVGEATIRKGRVRLDLPPLVENGNVVPMTVSVDSPMTKDNFVKAIHVVNEKNPQPNVISVQLGARAGKAEISTRIRLATTQNLMAIAEMSDGTCWSDTQEVVVTLAACLEDLQP
jgi:sulfur-oxidizing protein SoxY